MILGLAKNTDRNTLETRRVAKGLFVVMNAYAGNYEYFAEVDCKVEQTCYDNSDSGTSDTKGDDSNRRSVSEPHCD